MEPADLSKFPDKGEHYLFCDAVKDDLQVSGSTLQTCHFRRVGAKNASFEQSSLTQCLFEDTYFRKAHFSEVNLTGSTFKNCNFEKASFQGCNLLYCSFHATRLNPDEIINNLPTEPNLKRDLARNLRKNFETLGDKDSADIFLDIEIEAHEQELLGILRRKTEYYKSRYTGFDQATAGLRYSTSKLSGIVWGYGHRVRRLVVSYLVLTFLFGFITYFCDLPFFVDTQASARSLGFWESIYYTFAEILSLGASPFAPASALAKGLQLFQGLLGTLFLALLAAAAYRRIAR